MRTTILLPALIFFCLSALLNARADAAADPKYPDWVQWTASPNHSPRRGGEISAVIYHYTAGGEQSGTVKYFQDRASRVSAHYVIGRDGKVVQMVALDQAAWHAGVSQLAGVSRVNNFSVGIEICNYGKLTKKEDKFYVSHGELYRGPPPIHAAGAYWEPYTDAQYDSLARLTNALLAKYPIKHITGHSDIALPKGRKIDPGPALDYGRIKPLLAKSYTGQIGPLEKTRTADDAKTPAHRTGAYILGADISWVQEDEAEGSTYYDHGVRKDIFQILKDNGFNYIRLRVFVNPASPRGYAARSKEAFCDAAHTLAMAKRVRAAGMGLLVDFHYSDTWADPGHQFKPAAWETLDFPALEKAVYDHTHSVVSALKEQGTTPDMVQIGNEVTNGMLWPDGRAKDHFDNFAELVKSGIAAARAVDPAIKIVLHHDKGNNNQVVRWWLDNLISRGVQFDIIGLSCNSDGPAEKWKANFDDLASRYPQYGLLAAEYSYRKRELNDVVYNVPDRRGLGSFIWEPTRHHEAIFDREGRNAGGGTQRPPRSAQNPVPKQPAAPGHRPRSGRFDTNDLIKVYAQMAKDYGNGAAGESPPKQITNSIGMKLTLVPSGEFMMGSVESAEETAAFFKKNYGLLGLTPDDFAKEHPRHRVRIRNAFFIATYHVTRGQFRRFIMDSGFKTDGEKADYPVAMGWDAVNKEFRPGKEYSWRNVGFEQTDEHPVLNVSWNDAVAFCKWLSKKDGKDYRLPTEAEWEYACRGGTTTRYYNGDDPEALAKVANVADAALTAKLQDWKGSIKASDGFVFTAPVGQFRPNAFGLYDMHGNACQWCADWYNEDYYGQSPVDNPKGPDNGETRVIRGGSWFDYADGCRSSQRWGHKPSDEGIFTGFRVAVTP